MSRGRRITGLIASVALIAATVPLMSLPAMAVSAPEVVASGLDSPYKLAEGPDGAIYVAESGSGGPNCATITGPEGEEVEACVGETGAVTKIADGVQSKAVTGLPSLQFGMEVIGPTGLDFNPNGDLHVVVGLGGDTDSRAEMGDSRFGTLLKVSNGETSVVADLAAFEQSSDPDQGLPGVTGPDSNPFGLAFDGSDALVADAGGNTLVRVTPDGTMSTEALFPPRNVDPPPFIPVPGPIPMQSVPTAVELDGEGVIHVSELTGFPFPVNLARIYSVDEGTVTPAFTGFTNIVDFAIAEDGTLYVLEFAANGLLSPEPEAALVQVRTDGTRKTLLAGSDLPVPGGVMVGSDGMVYLSVCTLCGPGQGMVWSIDPSVASDASIASACDPDDVPGTQFGDIAGNIHQEAIECMAWWGVVTGFSAFEFGPNGKVTRAQTASMIARALRSAGVDLPASSSNTFPDDDGSVHEQDIEALVEAGIVKGRPDGTFDPDTPVTRAELTTLLARAYESATGEGLPAGSDAFTDDDGSVHEADINAVAAIGWVKGVGGGLFKPDNDATRGEFSTMISRMLATLVDEGVAALPGG